MTVISKFAAKQQSLGLTGSRVAFAAAILGYLGGVVIPKCYKAYSKSSDGSKETRKDVSKSRKSNPAVNKQFFKQLKTMLKLMIPSLWSVEAGILSVHTLVLVTRTFLSIYVARLEGRMVKHIVRKDVASFAWLLATWFGVAIPATFINSLIRFLESKLAWAFRTRLVNEAYNRYLGNEVYYRVSNLDGRLDTPDHCLTDDIASFSSSVAHLYSHISKPLLDASLITFSLFQLSRAQKSNVTAGPLLAGTVVWGTGRLLRLVSPKFGELVADEAARKGHLRFIHSRIITNAEEIAFYSGEKVELENLRDAYSGLVKQASKIHLKRLWYIMLEQFLMKYGWAGTGMIMISIPILTSQRTSAGESGVSERTEYYTTAKNLLTSGADAMERLMTAYKEVVELAGYTSRVHNMFNVFTDCANSRYERGVVRECQELELKDGVPLIKGQVQISNGDIVLDRVPIVTPNCDIVVPSLSIQVSPGQHVLVSGPNGCGKSSLFRILSGLWPVYKGRLQRPASEKIIFIPQRPYMTIGTLRDQVIYPDNKHQMRHKGFSDLDLETILEIVNLNHIVTREGGWDTTSDWKDILSGGEKQRMGLARLFYQRPAWAMLDECTSAVSIDVEGKIYQAAKDAGVTLLTITHRPTLAQFHTHLLKFDGQGGWKFGLLSTEMFSSLSEEKEQIENKLDQVDTMKARLEEIEVMMGQDARKDRKDGQPLHSD